MQIPESQRFPSKINTIKKKKNPAIYTGVKNPKEKEKSYNENEKATLRIEEQR